MTCGVPRIGATFDIDAKEVMNVSAQGEFKDRPNQIDITNEEARLYLAGIDCTTNAAEKRLDDDDVSKMNIEESDCMTELNTLVEVSYEDKSEASDVEKSGRDCDGCPKSGWTT